jgi:beta-glucanase (GH16 family)
LGFSQRYGYFEARLKIPAGAGTMSAFWLGSNFRGVRDNHIEVDIMEHFGWTKFERADRYNTILINHGAPSGRFGHKVQVEVDTFDITDNWHTYGALLHPKKGVYWYKDRKLIRHDPYVVHDPVHMILNLAGHPGWGKKEWDEHGDPATQELRVDYVRAFQPFWPEPQFL